MVLIWDAYAVINDYAVTMYISGCIDNSIDNYGHSCSVIHKLIHQSLQK